LNAPTVRTSASACGASEFDAAVDLADRVRHALHLTDDRAHHFAGTGGLRGAGFDLGDPVADQRADLPGRRCAALEGQAQGLHGLGSIRSDTELCAEGDRGWVICAQCGERRGRCRSFQRFSQVK